MRNLLLTILFLTLAVNAYPATATYYFNAKSTSNWTDSANMIDGSTDTFGYSSTLNTQETLTGNTCDGSDLGTITKVEISLYGHGESAGNSLSLTGVYAGGNGTPKNFVLPETPGLISYVAITTDTNAPSPWTWADVDGMDILVKQGTPLKQEDVYAVYVKVTYTPNAISQITTGQIGASAVIN